MKTLKIFVVLTEQQLKTFNFSEYESPKVRSIHIIDHESQEENIAQLLDANLVVNYTTENDPIIQNVLVVARILNRPVIHFSRLREYVK